VAIALRYAARSDVGLVRQNNQDSGYAGPHLLVVADGMGGHAGGDVASSLAIGELAPLDGESHGSDALEHLSKAVLAAHRELLGRVSEEPQLAGMGTTVTALLRTGSKLALAHIGDSRAYLLRDGGLVQITKDHTFVQTLVDEGRLTPEEAEQHPQRSVLMRVLSDVVEDVEPDLSMREARVGDRYLLCSDGLSGVVSFDTLRDTLAAGQDPATTCDALVQLATRGGAPDNVTCIVADIIEAIRLGDDAPAVVGAASTGRQTHRIPPNPNGSPAERAAALTAGRPVVPELPAPPRRKRRALRRVIGALIVVVVVVAGAFAALRWVQNQYFVGDRSGAVAIFRGLPQEVGPLHFSWVDEVAPDVRTKDLPQYLQARVRQGMQADSQADAKKILATLSSQAFACREAAREAATASPSPSPTSPSPVTSPPETTPTGTAGARSSGAALGTPRTTAGVTRTTTAQGPDQVVGAGAVGAPSATATLGTAAQDVNPQATNATTAAPTGSPGTPATAQDCRELPQ
jgi:serine/threonine protein phosphatase PrpC